MILKIKIPPYPLRTLVNSVIYYEGYSAGHAYEKLLPDGYSRLIIELDGNTRVLKSKDQQPDTFFNKAWVAGIQTGAVTYQSEINATTLCIQFETGGLYALSKIPETEFSNIMIDAAQVFGNSIDQLRERVLACTCVDDIFLLIFNFLEGHILKFSSKQQLSNYVKNKLCFENTPIGSISEEIGYSQKHLIYKFKESVGISPKAYQRIFRFNKAILLMQSQEQPDYSDIVFNCNFYDQAHFINEFRYFTGFTPGQYRKEKVEYPHIIPFDNLR